MASPLQTPPKSRRDTRLDIGSSMLGVKRNEVEIIVGTMSVVDRRAFSKRVSEVEEWLADYINHERDEGVQPTRRSNG